MCRLDPFTGANIPEKIGAIYPTEVWYPRAEGLPWLAKPVFSHTEVLVLAPPGLTDLWVPAPFQSDDLNAAFILIAGRLTTAPFAIEPSGQQGGFFASPPGQEGGLGMPKKDHRRRGNDDRTDPKSSAAGRSAVGWNTR